MKTYLFFKRLLFVWVFAISASVWGQTVVTHTFTGLSGTIDSNISYTTEKNTSGTTPSFITELRLYSNPANDYAGNSITLIPSSGVTITAVELNAISTTYTPTMKYTIGVTTFSASDPNMALNSTKYTLSGLNVTNYLKMRNGSNASTQGRFNSIKVTYTPATPTPTVLTTSATTITTNNAILTGTINANNLSTIPSFEYGTTISYGNNVSATPSPVTGTTVTNITSGVVSSLALNTLYNFRAKGLEGTTTYNGGNQTFYTLAATPGAVILNNAQLTTLDVSINASTQNSNPAITKYAIQESNGQYVQDDGSLGASASWQTAATWGTKTITGLTSATSYTFSTKARNGDNLETAFGASTSLSTLTPLGTPVAIAATSVETNSFTANWNTVSGATGYELEVSKSPTFGTFTTGTISEGFESATFPPTGWITTNWERSISSNDIKSGSGAAICQAQNGTLTTTAVANPTSMTFFLGRTGNTSAKSLLIEVSTSSQSSGFTTVTTFDHSNVPSGSYNQYTVDLSAYANSSVVYIRFTKSSSTTSPWRLDDIVINYGTATPDFVSGYNPKNITGGSTISANVSGLATGTKYYYRVRATNGNQSPDSNTISTTTAGPVTWNGSAWSNTDGPDAAKDAIIAEDYTGASFTAKKLTVNSTKTLTINTSVTADEVINEGTIIVADNASFFQTPAGTYSGGGTFKVNRTSASAANKYAFWSSPVVAQDMYQIYPGTTIDKVMTYNTSNNLYILIANPSTATRGVGYSIKIPAATNATFVGVPNNGGFTTALSLDTHRFNLVGNPYPSPMDLSAFYSINSANIESTVYFWDNTSNNITTQSGSTTTNLGYATANISGSTTWTPADNSQLPIYSGNNIKIGQGFIVKAKLNANDLAFNNTVRVGDIVANNFNKNNSSNQNEGKYWLTLKSSYNYSTTQAITYQTNASDLYDAYDSKSLGSGSNAFYSFAGNEKLVIQGKSDFDVSDVVVLGNKHFESGNYTIELSKKEGLFANGQAIYLRDKLLGAEINLQNQDYTFTTNAGEFSNRFEIVYVQSTLATETDSTKEGLTLYRDGENFIIKSPSKIKSVEVYDASGKLIQSLKSKSDTEIVRNLAKGVYVIKIITATETVSKKVIK